MEKKVGSKRKKRAWRCSSVVKHFPSKHKTLNSVPMGKNKPCCFLRPNWIPIQQMQYRMQCWDFQEFPGDSNMQPDLTVIPVSDTG